MRRWKLRISLALVACTALPLLAHHAASSIVDEEVYEMIEALVADTPHAEMTLDDLGSGMTQTVISTRTLPTVESMIDDGLLTYAAMLDGDVEVVITFGRGSLIDLTINQLE